MDPVNPSDDEGVAADEPDFGELLFATTCAEAAAVQADAPAEPRRASRGRWTTVGAVAASAVLAMAVGLAINWPGAGRGHPTAAAPPVVRPTQPTGPRWAPLVLNPGVVPQVLPPLEPAFSSPAMSLSATEVNRAVDRGVSYLRQHGKGLHLPCRYEGLLGLTLLECGERPNDPLVQRIAASLRKQAGTMHQTYHLATTIFFFDRLGDPQDRLRIRMLAERLLDGQTSEGTWSYSARTYGPPLPIVYGAPIVVFSNGVAHGKVAAHGNAAAVRFGPPHPGHFAGSRGDHSNTQFATLALWIAQRHGVDTRDALRRVEQHFREVQSSDGSWGYKTRWSQSRLANTGAGLLGLAVGHGIDRGIGRDARLRRQPLADPAVIAALGYLGEKVAAISLDPGGRDIVYRLSPFMAVEGRDALYTFWSLERTATLYGLTHFGNRPWYPWVAQCLVAAQQPDGRWQHALGPEVDTCFALLVLRRSNLAADLGRVLRDPLAVPPDAALPKVITPDDR